MNINPDNFEKAVTELYSIMIQPISELYKGTAVQNCRKDLGLYEGSSFSEAYDSIINGDRESGTVYTPIEISGYMIRKTILPADIIEDPYLKILDPACGSGNIIIPCFHYLRDLYMENLKEINERHRLCLNSSNINGHIIANNLFGFDLNQLAVKVLQIDLFCAAGYMNKNNFEVKDYLLDEIVDGFGIILGNPPYIGHKTVERCYSKALKEKYKGIYLDKGDISYCFFQKSIGLLDEKGKLTFITSRYFMESPSGRALRRIITRDNALSRLVDFYGIRPFKGIGIDPVIVFMDFNKKERSFFEVIRPAQNTGSRKREFLESLISGRDRGYLHFTMKPQELNEEGWILKTVEELAILEKIRKNCSQRLRDIAESYQGIITGFDRAFVMKREDAEEAGIETELLKPWIKSSAVGKNRTESRNQLLIYSDLIEDEGKYPNAIRYISACRDRLSKRRECMTGARKWYMLQWGRKQSIFEGEKIVFPYKSDSNRFALDRGSYFSADVYSLVLKDGSGINIEKLAMILNSSLYEFYFKSFAKKLGEGQYEYYPNNIMKLFIPTEFIEGLCGEEDLCRYFGLTDREISIIKKEIK
ncbi:MAG: N-6 DNA methylase [Clostridiaceae bacterium]